MSVVRQAVVLAAGEGKRLRPLTLSEPKCMARVNGVRIIDNALEGLAASGCRTVTIVIGYLADRVRSALGERQHGMQLRYIENAQFATTNSMFSLAMGLRAVDAPCWVVEGDVFFETSVLAASSEHDITWVVDSSCRSVDGSFIGTSNGQAVSAAIIRDLSKLRAHDAKSVGMLRLNNVGNNLLTRWLDEAIFRGKVNDYYDVILSERISSGDTIGVIDIAGRRWFEIDSLEDLLVAERIFNPERSRDS